MKKTNLYWKVKITRLVEQADTGKIKKSNEDYLVNAVSPTDAEAKITEMLRTDVFEWSVTSITETKYLKIIE